MLNFGLTLIRNVVPRQEWVASLSQSANVQSNNLVFSFIVSGTEELHSEIHQLKSYIKELHSEFHQLKSYTKDLKDAVRSMQPNHQVLEDAPIAGPSGQHNDSRSESMAPPSQPWESSVEEEILPEAFGIRSFSLQSRNPLTVQSRHVGDWCMWRNQLSWKDSARRGICCSCFFVRA
jgi:hypothetical protein